MPLAQCYGQGLDLPHACHEISWTAKLLHTRTKWRLTFERKCPGTAELES